MLFTIWRAEPPEARPLDAPVAEFSAARALEFHRRIFPTNTPHPIGSPEARAVERRIVAELDRLGIEHDIQESYVCGDSRTCATVRNVLGHLPGATRQTILLASHYDSVPAGPGASDDGASVAALLETARSLRSDHLQRDVLVLFDEGEEPGLLGAEAFIRKHPRAPAVVAVVNGEARGTSGQSFMFETSPGNRHLIDLFASNAKRPVTSSVFFSIYERLPNDTDFSVFKRYDRQGLNFAFLGDVARYHTPLDRRDLLDPRTLQHHGDNILAASRALANGSLRQTRSNATFFDVGGFFVARWPEAFNRYLGLAALVAAFLGIRRGKRKQNWWSLLLFPAAIVSAAAIAAGLVWLLRKSGALPTEFIAHPTAMLFGAWLLGFLAACTVRLVATREERETSGTISIVCSVLALLLAWFLPGAAYLFLIPAICLLLPLYFPGEQGWRVVLSIVPLAVACLLFFALLLRLYPTLGNVSLILIAASSCVLALLMPGDIVVGRRALTIGGVLAVVLFSTPLFLPAYSPSSPRGLNIVSNRDEWDGQCRWLVDREEGALPSPLKNALAWAPYRYTTSSGLQWQTMSALHPCGGEPAPGVEQVEGSTEGATRILRYRMYSPRHAPTLIWTFENGAGIASVVVNGETVPDPSPRAARRMPASMRQIQFRGVPPEGVAVELHLRGPQSVPGILTDSAPLLDASAAPLAASRNQSMAVRIAEGDVSIIRRRITLGP